MLKTYLKRETYQEALTTFNSKDLEFILHYITLTRYYILNNTFRGQVITANINGKNKTIK